MKRVYAISVVVLCVVGVLASIASGDCPDRKDHRAALSRVLLDEMMDRADIPEENAESAENFSSGMGTTMVGRIVGGKLVVRNHTFFSTGELTFIKEKDRVVSVGVFGHVFVRKEKLFKHSLKEYPSGPTKVTVDGVVIDSLDRDAAVRRIQDKVPAAKRKVPAFPKVGK